MNRLQSFLTTSVFALIALFGVSVPSALAACDVSVFAGGSGTSGSPWQIATPMQLSNLRECTGEEHNDKYFILTADLNISAYGDEDGWMPISGYSDGEVIPFYGHVNGNNKIITGLNINRAVEYEGGTYAGLFGIFSGTLTNLGFEDASVRGESNVGVIAGRAIGAGTSVSQVYVADSSVSGVNRTYVQVGGFFGEGFDVHIEDSYASVSIEAYPSHTTGSIAGYTTSGFTLERVYGASAITLVGEESGGITGGLVGGSAGGTFNIEKSFFIGGITLQEDVYVEIGGIAGKWGNGDNEDLRWFDVEETATGCIGGTEFSIEDPDCESVDSAEYFMSSSNVPMNSWDIEGTEDESTLLDSGLPILAWQLFGDAADSVWVIRGGEEELPSVTVTTGNVNSISSTTAHMYGTAQLNNGLSVDHVAEGDILLGFILNDTATVDWDNYIHSAPTNSFQIVGGDDTQIAFDAVIEGLECNTQYWYVAAYDYDNADEFGIASNVGTFTTAACASGGNNGGGGGGGSGSRAPSARTPVVDTTPVGIPAAVAQILTQYRSLFVQAYEAGITLPQNILTFLGIGGTPTPAGQCPRSLTVGDEGEDVRALQRLLMNLGYPIAPGATGFFVNYTRDALAEYQRANGLTPAAGYFGPATCAHMKAAGHPGLWW